MKSLSQLKLLENKIYRIIWYCNKYQKHKNISEILKILYQNNVTMSRKIYMLHGKETHSQQRDLHIYKTLLHEETTLRPI